jgi:ATP-binding cassette subfamily B multidrug efflux pump
VTREPARTLDPPIPSPAPGPAPEAAPASAPAAVPAVPPTAQLRANAGMRRMGPMASAGMPVERSRDFSRSLRRLLGLLRPERLGLAAVVVLAVTSVTLAVVGPKILGHGTDIIISGLAHGGPGAIDFAALHRTLLFVAALYAGGSVLAYSQGFILAGIVQRRMFRLRADVEAKLHRLPLGYVDRQPRGDLLSRVTNDIDNVAQSLQQTLSQMLTSVLTLVGTVVMMFVVSWLLALIALVTVPLSITVIAQIAKRAQTRFKAQWEQTGHLNALVEETFTGHNVVKAFGRQPEVDARFEVTNDRLHDASFGAQLISGSTQPVMAAFGNLNFVLVAVVGGLRVAAGALTIGSVQAFIQYSRQFTQPLTQVAAMINVFQSGVASAERVFEFLDAPEEVPDPTEPVALTVEGRVEFDRVSFAYDPDRPLITDLSFVAEPGQTVAIVGPTGAGKTTLVNLIMRFYDLDGGRVLLDGVDIASLPRRALRSKIAMVLQDTWLFEGTIGDNIAYGDPSAPAEEVLAAARATYVDRFVRALPAGYDTRLSDEEGAVSAGEKQLLTIARAFLANPMILILDEATSSVDTRTEVLVQQAMAALRSDRTSFVIAHRLSTIRDADVILVMEDGHIVEQGSHDELLRHGGHYAALWRRQSGGFIDADDMQAAE